MPRPTAVLAVLLSGCVSASASRLSHLTAFNEYEKRMAKQREEAHPLDSQLRAAEYSDACERESERAAAVGSTDIDRVEYSKCRILKGMSGGEEDMEKEAEAGSRYAQKMYGSFLHAKNSTSEAVEMWEKCSASGDLECEVNIGMAYLTGANDVEADHSLAFKRISGAAQKGDAIGQYNLGMILLEGLPGAGIAIDRKGALSNLLKAAQRKNTKAMVQLAIEMLTNGQKGTKDQRKQQAKGALRWLTEAHDLGSIEATARLGMCYKHGLGVRADNDKAFKYFQKAAEEGNAGAQYELAMLYIYDEDGGSDMGYDDVLARKWMFAAAVQGHANAMHNYANILMSYEDARKSKKQREKDIQEALSFFAAAAQEGVPDSLFALGAFHAKGDYGLAKNMTLAAQYLGTCSRIGSKKCRDALFGIAEQHKVPEAVFQLGRLHEEGALDGSVEADASEAKTYFKEAMLLNSVSAREWEESRTTRETEALQRKKQREALDKKRHGGDTGDAKKSKKTKKTDADSRTETCQADDDSGQCS